jgi:hypothetical protein
MLKHPDATLIGLLWSMTWRFTIIVYGIAAVAGLVILGIASLAGSQNQNGVTTNGSSSSYSDTTQLNTQ